MFEGETLVTYPMNDRPNHWLTNDSHTRAHILDMDGNIVLEMVFGDEPYQLENDNSDWDGYTHGNMVARSIPEFQTNPNYYEAVVEHLRNRGDLNLPDGPVYLVSHN